MSKYVLNMRADPPWLSALDDLAVKLRLGTRSRVVDVAIDILSDLAEMNMPPRCLHPEQAVTERFTVADKARLLENASTVLAREVHGDDVNGIIYPNGGLPRRELTREI